MQSYRDSQTGSRAQQNAVFLDVVDEGVVVIVDGVVPPPMRQSPPVVELVVAETTELVGEIGAAATAVSITAQRPTLIQRVVSPESDEKIAPGLVPAAGQYS